MDVTSDQQGTKQQAIAPGSSAYTTLFIELVRLEIELWERLDRLQRADVGISVAQLQSLRAVALRAGSARVQDISDDLQITVGAASKVIDRLAHDGLVERSPHPVDRRSMVITLTPRGAAAYESASSSASRHLAAVLGSGMDEGQAGALSATLSALSSSLRRGAKS
ncbi:MarR family winged helix-turn-helix transcriptional regulator [Subtercola frigoramans]|uniref:DNA-binding MarR family transcriptional regulator n=1 Tax=Subtercola frigoramans TaxID=120298 RepID=A0ABS2L174_9MICO|nr:MarR family transcriptional regulator [Subtercola frigoramans]MBM7470779.1 DNA-binding MarR family transcriptional regulator [Subtercola frigoramans]